jgi:hypothetical protein
MTMTETKPRKRFFGGLLPSTLASQMALAAAGLLMLILVVVLAIFWFNADHVPWRHAITQTLLTEVCLLLIAVPTLVYIVVANWGRSAERFPDIDLAWRTGLEALKQSGVRLEDKPVFLIIGSGIQAVMEASIPNLVVSGVPQDSAVEQPLHWYAAHDRIYLFCTNAGCSSDLSRRRAKPFRTTAIPMSVVETTDASGPIGVSSPQRLSSNSQSSTNDGSDQAFVPAANFPARREPAAAAPIKSDTPDPSPMNTVVEGDSLGQGTSAINMESDDSASHEVFGSVVNEGHEERPPTSQLFTIKEGHLTAVNFHDTKSEVTKRQPTVEATKRSQSEMTGNGASTPGTHNEISAAKPLTGRTKRQSQEKKLRRSSDSASSIHGSTAGQDAEAAEQKRRLQYLCELLRRSRWPRCGSNGLVVLIPYSFLALSRPDNRPSLSGAMRLDITTIRNTLGLRVPITLMITGGENESGFRVFTERLGPGQDARRLGKSFNLGALPTPNNLDALTRGLSSAFEDFVYTSLGKNQPALNVERSNRKLFAMLCRIRQTLLPNIRIVLAEVFGTGTETDDELLLSGCYFSATGQEQHERAFIKGVFYDKLWREQAYVTWTKNAQGWHQKYAWLGICGWLGVTLSLCFLSWMLWTHKLAVFAAIAACLATIPGLATFLTGWHLTRKIN